MVPTNGFDHPAPKLEICFRWHCREAKEQHNSKLNHSLRFSNGSCPSHTHTNCRSAGSSFWQRDSPREPGVEFSGWPLVRSLSGLLRAEPYPEAHGVSTIPTGRSLPFFEPLVHHLIGHSVGAARENGTPRLGVGSRSRLVFRPTYVLIVGIRKASGQLLSTGTLRE